MRLIFSLIFCFVGIAYANNNEEIIKDNQEDNEENNEENNEEDVCFRYVHSGITHTFAIDDDLELWISGGNEMNQLGTGDFKSVDEFTLTEIKNVKKIQAGWDHSILLSTSGRIYMTGSNEYGKLGFGDDIYRLTWTPNYNIPKMKDISVAKDQSYALDYQGNVWSTGNNYSGQLGLGSKRKSFDKWTKTSLSSIVKIATGGPHALALSVDGDVYGAGYNYEGALGLKHNEKQIKATKNWKKIDLDEVKKGLRIKDISTGWDHSLFIDFDGNVWVAGDNDFGELGLNDEDDTYRIELTPSKLENIVKISAGHYSSYAVDASGRVFVTGQNSYGQLGVSGQNIKAWEEVENMTDIKFISNGNSLTAFAIDFDCALWATGDGKMGQIGGKRKKQIDVWEKQDVLKKNKKS